MQLPLFSRPAKQSGAFLVIALIILIVLSSLGIALMALATTAERVSNNYAQYVQAKIKAMSMANYAERILNTWANGVYFGPGTCTTTSTCNQIQSSFPMNGRPLLPWVVSSLGNPTIFNSSQSNSWWNTNAFAYEGSFAGSGNARVVVEFLGNNTASPYQNTYRIVGYATDANSGTVKATYQQFYVWNSYPTDPGAGTCSGGCYYGQCCNGTSCGYDSTTCNASTATYVPPGWTCTTYFANGLGYSGSVCTNPICSTVSPCT